MNNLRLLEHTCYCGATAPRAFGLQTKLPKALLGFFGYNDMSFPSIMAFRVADAIAKGVFHAKEKKRNVSMTETNTLKMSLFATISLRLLRKIPMLTQRKRENWEEERTILP